MEQVITGLVEGIVVPVTNAIAFAVSSGIAFVAFAVLWIVFAWALITSQGSLDAAWHWVRALPLIVQGLVWLLFLPVVLALWVWETAWPLVLRIVVVLGLAGWSLLIFIPKWLTGAAAR
jgi:hypothetical protein